LCEYLLDLSYYIVCGCTGVGRCVNGRTKI